MHRGSGAAAVGAALALLALCCPCADAAFNVEKSGLKITFPTEAKEAYPNGFEMALSEWAGAGAGDAPLVRRSAR